MNVQYLFVMNGERGGLPLSRTAMSRHRLVVKSRLLERRVPWPHRVAVRTPAPHRGTVALIGSGGPGDTGALLAQVRQGGYDVVLVDTLLPTGLPMGDAPAIADRLRVPAMTAAAVAEAIEGYSRRVQGVICWEPRYQQVAAAAALRLGLPSFGETAAIGSADPVSTQVLLAAAGMRTPRSILAVSPEEADRAAQLIGCPVLFVARTPGGNLSRRRVDDLAGIPAGFAGAQAATGDSGAVLVEEVPMGSPVTVECWVRSGAPIGVAVVRRFGQYEIVDAADPLTDDADVVSVIEAAVAAVGVHDGHCGVELLLSDDGAIVTGLRAGPPDALISHVVELVTGVNIPAAAAAISCGQDPAQDRHRQRRAALVTPVDIRAPRLEDLDDDLPYAGWIERYEPGGRAVVTGRSPRECALRAAQLRAAHLRAEHLYIPAEWPFLPPSFQRIREPEPQPVTVAVPVPAPTPLPVPAQVVLEPLPPALPAAAPQLMIEPLAVPAQEAPVEAPVDAAAEVVAEVVPENVPEPEPEAAEEQPPAPARPVMPPSMAKALQ